MKFWFIVLIFLVSYSNQYKFESVQYTWNKKYCGRDIKSYLNSAKKFSAKIIKEYKNLLNITIREEFWSKFLLHGHVGTRALYSLVSE